jgi:hypothetical protein
MAVVLCLTACGATTHRTNARHRPSARIAASTTALFAPDSVWNAPLSPDAPIDPTSPALMAQLRQEIAAEQQAQDGPWIETASSSTTVYRVPANQPTVAVNLENTQP